MGTGVSFSQAPTPTPAITWPNTYYFVSSSIGNNAYDGKSPWNAWNNLTHAIFQDGVKAGSVLIARGGDTWAETLTLPRSGTDGNPISLVADTNGTYFSGASGKFILDGQDTRTYGIYSTQDYWNISGVQIQCYTTGINWLGGDYVSISDFNIQSNRYAGVINLPNGSDYTSYFETTDGVVKVIRHPDQSGLSYGISSSSTDHPLYRIINNVRFSTETKTFALYHGNNDTTNDVGYCEFS